MSCQGDKTEAADKNSLWFGGFECSWEGRVDELRWERGQQQGWKRDPA